MMRVRACPAPLGQQETGVPVLDKIIQHPIGRALTIGTLGAGLAKAFPGQFFAPLVAGAVTSVMIGLVPDVKVSGVPKSA